MTTTQTLETLLQDARCDAQSRREAVMLQAATRVVERSLGKQAAQFNLHEQNLVRETAARMRGAPAQTVAANAPAHSPTAARLPLPLDERPRL